MSQKVLLIIDIQNDFLPGGSLAVENSDEIIPIINDLMSYYFLVVATQDWHPKNHVSLISNHPDKNVFDIIDINSIPQTLWPDHCIQESNGAAFPLSLRQSFISCIFRKGMHTMIDSYSAFKDNQRTYSTGLASYLRGKNVNHIDIVGLAADYCVYYSIKDALMEGFSVTLLENATRAIDVARFHSQKQELSAYPNFSITQHI